VVRPREGATPRRETYDVWMRTENENGTQVEQGAEAVRQTLAKFLGGSGFADALQEQGVGEEVTQDVALSTPFPSVDVIGSSVANRLRNDALIALVLSLLGIIVYIALRFSSRAMGLAAVICLFHDVAITLGIVAVANIYGLVNAKISLPMVAAFLTLVGYSVNDTVVVFDRIRENRGKKRVITPGMIDLSINQTLARTIKTSATFLLAALALFVFNYGQRNVLEGFSFILIIGSVIGTYSTVAIASPLLLYLPWLWERIRGLRPRGALVTGAASRWYGLPFVPVMAVLWVLWLLAFGVVGFFAGLLLFPVWAMSEKVESEPEKATEAVPA
jgi:preprotein translocase SecF subunit